MVHWPEVMTAYEETEKILFSADAFGRFGSLERTARAPLGAAGPTVLLQYYREIWHTGAGSAEKTSALEIQNDLPAHGPVLTEGGWRECLRLYGSLVTMGTRRIGELLIAHASMKYCPCGEPSR